MASVEKRGQRGRRPGVDLEKEVRERTAELERANQQLRDEIAERKKIEAELRRNEAFLNEAQRLGHTTSWIYEIPSGAPRHMSPEMFRLMGLDPAEPIPRVAWGWDVVHPDDRERVMQVLTASILAKTDYEIEHRILRTDGTIRTIAVVGHPVLDASGKVTHVIGTSMDVTEQRAAEAELRRKEAFLVEVQRLSRTRSWISPIAPQPESISGDDFRVVGLDQANPAPPVAWNWDVVHPDDRERVQKIVSSAILARKGYEFEHRVVLPDGRAIVAHVRGHPVVDASGNVTEYIGTSTDVTRQRAAEAELRKQAELLSLSHEAVIVREPDGRISFWNRGAEETYGFTAEEALGQIAHELLRTTFPDSRAVTEAIVREHGRWDGEVEQVRRDGTRIAVASRWSQQRDDRGRPAAVLETNTDISARNRAHEALQQAQAKLAHVARVTTLGELTASIAHEVNQPLAAILNNANACLGLLPPGTSPELEEIRAALADITVDAERASAVIDRVRALARRSPPESERLQLGDVVGDVVILAARELATRRITIRRDAAESMPIVMGDRVQLQQVLLNLVVNGTDAMMALDEGERLLEISESAETLEGRPAATIRVRDRGVGLGSADTDRLFEAFYTTKPNGMGMGLAISRSIIDAHGGRMWVESNAGPGACFAFTLPSA